MESCSQSELQEYKQCLQLRFGGGHTSNIASCPYCAETYRRYHQVAKPVTAEEETIEVCECCEGKATNCQSPGCAEFGVCLSCSVD